MSAARRLACSLLWATAVVGLLCTRADAGTLVRFETILGVIEVDLLDEAMPTTVANFLSYVNAGSYDSTIIHRSTTYNPNSIQIVQGGGYVLVGGTSLAPVATFPPLVFESGTFTNARGTIAMARGAALDSATSQFYFNVQDNPALDGNYAVFGSITGPEGLATLDAIGAVDVYDVSPQLGPVFSELPLTAPSLQQSSLVMVNRVQAVPEPSTIALAAVGAVALAFARPRRLRRD